MLDHPGRLPHIIELLCRAVAAHIARLDRGLYAVWIGTRLYVEKTAPSPHKPIARDIWLLLTRRADRLAQRFQTLVQRWRSGTLPATRPPRPPLPLGERAGVRGVPHTGRTPPTLRLPRERGWINKRLGDTAQCAGLLHAMLQDAEVARFHAEVPRAGRLLRPLVHALGLTPPDWLKLPERRHKPRICSPPAHRREPEGGASPGTPPTPYRPLQPYVRAAARAWNKHAWNGGTWKKTTI